MAFQPYTSVNAAQERVVGSARNLAISTAISRILGFCREILTAKIIGGDALMSGWVLAQTFANIFRRILGEGELGKALVPLLSQTIHEDGYERAKEQFSTILLWLTALLTVLALIFGLPPYLIAPCLPDGSWKTACYVMPIVSPYIVFICIVGATSVYLNTLKEYFLPSLTAVLQNLVMIAGLYFLCPRYEGLPRLHVLAFSVLVSGMMELLFILFLLRRKGALPKLTSAIIHDFPVIAKMWKLVLPGMIAVSALQLSMVCDRIFATMVGDYAPSAIYYAERLIGLPIGIFAVSFATVANTEMSNLAASREYGKFTELLTRTIRVLVFVSLPFSAFMCCFPEDITRFFFFRGAFGETALKETSYALMMYACGIPMFAVYKITSISFTARQDMKTPLYVSMSCVVLNIALNVALMIPFRQGGIAIATGISSLVNSCALLTIYNQHMKKHPVKSGKLIRAILKLLPVCLLPLIPVWLIRYYVIKTFSIYVILPVSGILYGILLFGFAKLFRVEEIEVVTERFLRRFKR